MIRSVTGDGVRIGDAVYTQTIGLTVDSVIDDWEQKALAELVEDDFAALLEVEPEVIVHKHTGEAGAIGAAVESARLHNAQIRSRVRFG